MRKRNIDFVLVVAFLTLLILSVLPLTASAHDFSHRANRAKGTSWLGRAVPVDPICEPGTEGCVIPPEIVMLFTVYADGTFVGIDSQTFGGGLHTTAHGEWIPIKDGFEATFTFLQSENDLFIGGFRNRMQAHRVQQFPETRKN